MKNTALKIGKETNSLRTANYIKTIKASDLTVGTYFRHNNNVIWCVTEIEHTTLFEEPVVKVTVSDYYKTTTRFFTFGADVDKDTFSVEDTTMFKTFANISDLFTKTAGCKLYLELSNGYFAPVLKTGVKQIANAMTKNDQMFCGDLTFVNCGRSAQVKLSK